MTGAIWRAIAQALRRAAAPLAWYYAVTLALPFANGAAQTGTAFVEHAVVVLVLPPVLIVLACATREMLRGRSTVHHAPPNAVHLPRDRRLGSSPWQTLFCVGRSRSAGTTRH